MLKREDLNHTGAHKINNTLGQALLARAWGSARIIAETGAGQHGVATATVCARFGLECVVYMGAEDVERQALNVYRMRLLGATVVPVESGTGPSRTPPTRRCATGSPTSRHALHHRLGGRARTLTRGWCGTSSPSLGERPGSRCWSSSAACPTPW